MLLFLLKALLLSALLLLSQAKSEYKVTNYFINITSVRLSLQYTGSDSYYLKESSPIVKKLDFIFHTHTYNDFYFKITDASKPRFEVPQYYPFPVDPLQNFSFPMAAADIIFSYTADPFDFKILRKQTQAVLFDTELQDFIYSDHYLQIGTQIDSSHIYGLGQRFHESFRKKDGKWTIFNRDRGEVIDNGTGKQTYGYYPYYFLRERNNLFHINYLRSSNGMDVIKQQKNNKHLLTFKVIGGVFDFRFFLGEGNAEGTIDKFNGYIGDDEIPPFWGFGYHQCRWGYKNASMLQQVLDNFEKYGLPLDTIWSDIDYMIKYQDFTIDESRFPLQTMKKITDKYKYIPIIDAGIKQSGEAYKEGVKRNIFIKEAGGSKDYIGDVWPGNTTFVDFFHPNASRYWQDMLDKLYQKVQFSGVWLDMNELTNFCVGACTPPTSPAVFDYSKDLPYQIGSDNIENKTISLNCTHYGGIQQSNVHVYFGFLQTVATNHFLNAKKKKPFIISRSTTIGSSRFGYHWTGDNSASWEFLKGSIADNFNLGIYGNQMVGPDICGFGANTTEELCSRWFQLGSLYMFARSHNSINSIDQEPYALGQKVLKSALTNLKLRYSLLKHIYGMFVGRRGLGTIFKPIFFEFPADHNAYADEVADTQFLLGNDLMSAPILEKGSNTRKVYFPDISWYDFHTGYMNKPGTSSITNQMTDKVPLFLREGTVIVTQNVDKVTKTTELNNVFILAIGLHYEQRLSTATHKVYVAIGNTLSVKNYHDDMKIEECKTKGCQYVFNVIYNIRDTGKTLELDIAFIGPNDLREEIFISGVHLYHDGKLIKHNTNIRVQGAGRHVIPIVENHLSIE